MIWKKIFLNWPEIDQVQAHWRAYLRPWRTPATGLTLDEYGMAIAAIAATIFASYRSQATLAFEIFWPFNTFQRFSECASAASNWVPLQAGKHIRRPCPAKAWHESYFNFMCLGLAPDSVAQPLNSWHTVRHWMAVCNRFSRLLWHP